MIARLLVQLVPGPLFDSPIFRQWIVGARMRPLGTVDYKAKRRALLRAGRRNRRR